MFHVKQKNVLKTPLAALAQGRLWNVKERTAVHRYVIARAEGAVAIRTPSFLSIHVLSGEKTDSHVGLSPSSE